MSDLVSVKSEKTPQSRNQDSKNIGQRGLLEVANTSSSALILPGNVAKTDDDEDCCNSCEFSNTSSDIGSCSSSNSYSSLNLTDISTISKDAQGQ